MHGLVLSAVQMFVIERFGLSLWLDVTREAKLRFSDFEPMLDYPEATGQAVLAQLPEVLGRPREDILEDLGTYLVTAPELDAVRRLLRFGGVTFEDFLHSVDDLPDRARLAVPDLNLPELQLREHTAAHFSLICRGNLMGFGYVMTGILRAMADDYGALAFVEYRGGGQGLETVVVTLLETTFASGRDFHFGIQVA